MNVLEQLSKNHEELEKLRGQLPELRAELKSVKSERAARNRELKTLRETVRVQGLKDGLPRIDERWLFANQASAEWILPPSGKRQVKLRIFGVARPVLVEFESETEVNKERVLRQAIAAAKKAFPSARG